MPPRTRGVKVSKATKENDCVLKSNKIKNGGQTIKPTRKALADKTNSASDDNTSILAENLPKKAVSSTESKNQIEPKGVRTRRVKKLPNRENISPNEVSISKDSCNKKSESIAHSVSKYKSPETKKESKIAITPLKINNLDNSLVNCRPKRICRLPSKFDDHSISPNKFIPVKPINASTPIANKDRIINKESVKKVQTKTKTKSASQKATQSSKNAESKQKSIKNYFNNKTAADTNNNAKKKEQDNKSTYKKCDLKIIDKDTSEGIINNKKTLKRDSSKIDVYEFTYDPNEEPPPAKKKRKKPVKKPAIPKIISVKCNYDRNLAKALAALKKEVSMKSSKPEEMLKVTPNINSNLVKQNDCPTVTSSNKQDSNMSRSIGIEKNYDSVRIEDIALAIQPNDDNIDYSPVNSPCQAKSPVNSSSHPKSPVNSPSHPKSPGNQNLGKPSEPLNIQDISFFDDNPAASSSMNTSTRHPLASPWRVEFENLPIKWQVNTYVKPNMTPAFESSFINFNDSKKKHVYTNMVPESNDTLPEIVAETPNLKQTSIISFIKEVVEKSANKKKKCKGTPVKANSLFEDTNMSVLEQSVNQTSEKSNENITSTHEVPLENTSNTTNLSTDNENVQDKNENDKPKKDNTYFGFDESEDQENISSKKKNKARSLRARTRGILQELNEQKGPMRAIIPVTAKSKPMQNAVHELFDGMKSATEPPVFPDATAANGSTEVTINEPTLPENVENEDSQSVHLFEDIDVVHLKPTRKSYGKPKRVAFRKNTLDSDTSPLSDLDQASSGEDLEDLSFKLPSIKPERNIKKKKSKKQKLSKKEEKEVEAWAASFNSMCEDIDEFDLVVE